jgi:hypothetical protein
MTLDTTYLYKIFKDGAYLGLLPNVLSDFSYSQQINTAGTTITVEVAQTLDTSSEPPEAIQTEAGDNIVTENEQIVTTERATQVMGDKDSGLIIANGNDLEVWEFSDYFPNGHLVFTGYQSRFKAVVGQNDNISLTFISYGKDLDDYIFGNNSYALQIENNIPDDPAIFLMRPDQGVVFHVPAILGQSFVVTAPFGATKISIRASLDRFFYTPLSATITMNVYSGDPLGASTLLSSAQSIVTSAYPTFQTLDFVFPAAISLVTSTNYFYTITSSDAIITPGSEVDTYASGSEYNGASGGTTLLYMGTYAEDLHFKIYSGTLLTDTIFTSYDPSQMIRDAVTGYQAQGGIVTYTGASIDDTGYSLDYSFITATILEIITKARELAPADWYWYVDPATQVLYFKETPTTATHNFILGNHITEFEFEGTIEYIKNVVYFTGGPTAGVNLLKKYTDTASLTTNRLGMQKLSDNRILAANEPSASSISTSFMDERSEEEFLASPLVISAQTYDLSTINIGDTVSIGGFGNFIDDVILQITTIEPGPDTKKLTLGRLPLRSDSYVDQIRRDLENQQTLDNPNTPS